MAFLVQHGYGKGTKIAQLADKRLTRGVILSPADEDPLTLKSTADAARARGLEVLVDPQTYIYSALPAGTGRNHNRHRIDFTGLRWSQEPAATERQLSGVRELNQYLNPDGAWIAPSVLQSAFADVWTPLALQLARGAAQEWPAGRVMATLAIDESAFSSSAAMDDWLDVATSLDVAGFYILVQRSNTQYPPVAWAPDRLANLLRLIYTLGEINGFRVHWGYSDSEGILGLAAGASSISTGWSFGLRQFSAGKWVPSGGGKPAVIRVPMTRLWTSVRAEGEASDLYSSRLRDQIFSRRTLQRFPTGNFGGLNRSEAQDLYLETIAFGAEQVVACGGVAARLDYVSGLLDEALRFYSEIAEENIILEPRYRSRVAALADALRLFRVAEKL